MAVRTKKIIIILACALLAVLVFLLSFSSVGGNARAATASEEVSDVISDLRKDKNFKLEDYPERATDYTLDVIQIAETSADELLIYVYQPAANTVRLTATGLNMARSEEVTGTKYYGLTPLSFNGVFAKYRVNGVTCGSDAARYYNISSIYRAFNGSIDKAPGGGNTISEIACKVGKLFAATTTADGVQYSLRGVETIEIKNKYVGFVNYDDGVKVGWGVTAGATSAHFVAFSTSQSMDKLLSASLIFNVQTMQYKQCANVTHVWHGMNTRFDYQYGETVSHIEQLNYTDKASNKGNNRYTWNRIQTTSEFMRSVDGADLTYIGAAAEQISNTQYVLNFYESGLSVYSGGGEWLPLLTIQALPFVGDVEVKGERVSDVSILRLEFEKDGQLYNLGVVDNKQTGSGSPSAASAFNFIKWLADKIGIPQWAVILIIVIICLIVVLPLLAAFLPVVFNVIKYIFKGLWIILTLPFRLIKWLSKRRRGKEQ